MKEFKDKIIIIGSGVVGIHAATKLIDGGYPGNLITIIDAGQDPYKRPDTELMKGFAGCGMKSDGKYTRSTSVGGQLAKYCGEDKAYELMDETIEMLKRFHPDPSKIIKSEPIEEPEFIKPYFNLRLFPVWHVGTDYLDTTGKNWYNWLVEKGVVFYFNCEVQNIDFQNQIIKTKFIQNEVVEGFGKNYDFKYDKLIYATGKSGIDLTQQLIDQNNLKTEVKASQIGVRFEVPQKYFQKLVDLAYDFKLYQKPTDDISIRSFCTNNDCAYVAVEETYGDISFNGHAKKDEKYRNNMTNFGIIMEIKGIDNPFEWSRNLVSKFQKNIKEQDNDSGDILREYKGGLYYSPNKTRLASTTAEGDRIKCFQIEDLSEVKEAFQGYYTHIEKFIEDMNKVFNFGDDWGVYIPEIKYVTPEIIVDHKNLSLIDYPNVYFGGDSLSARGIVVSGCHGLYIASSILG